MAEKRKNRVVDCTKSCMTINSEILVKNCVFVIKWKMLNAANWRMIRSVGLILGRYMYLINMSVYFHEKRNAFGQMTNFENHHAITHDHIVHTKLIQKSDDDKTAHL